MLPWRQTFNPWKVKIGLVSKSTKDCWTPDFRNIIPHIYGLHIYLGTECQLPPVFHFCTENSETLFTQASSSQSLPSSTSSFFIIRKYGANKIVDIDIDKKGRTSRCKFKSTVDQIIDCFSKPFGTQLMTERLFFGGGFFFQPNQFCTFHGHQHWSHLADVLGIGADD